MAFEFKFPDVGEGITEGLLVKWRVKEGDEIKEDQVVAEIETDKAVVEVPTPKAGKVLKLHFAENDTVRVGEALVTIGVADEKIEAKAKPADLAKEKKTERPASVVGELKEELEFAPQTPKAAVGEMQGARWAMPYVRQLARELSVDLGAIHGTGPGGRISEEDVRRAGQIKSAADGEKYGPVERVPFGGVRKSIAERLVRTTQSVAMVTHFDFADVGKLNMLRKSLEPTHGKLSFLPFFIRALIHALQSFPPLNSSLDEAAGEIIYKKYYNIGIAVDTEYGLVVPVIKNADTKGIGELAKILAGISERTRNRTVDLEELRGGTFTISNVGMVGGVFATPIMPYPQSAILAIGRIKEVPVVRDGKIEAGMLAPLSVSFDHRLIDGADAARFVNRMIDDLAHPENLI